MMSLNLSQSVAQPAQQQQQQQQQQQWPDAKAERGMFEPAPGLSQGLGRRSLAEQRQRPRQVHRSASFTGAPPPAPLRSSQSELAGGGVRPGSPSNPNNSVNLGSNNNNSSNAAAAAANTLINDSSSGMNGITFVCSKDGQLNSGSHMGEGGGGGGSPPAQQGLRCALPAYPLARKGSRDLTAEADEDEIISEEGGGSADDDDDEGGRRNNRVGGGAGKRLRFEDLQDQFGRSLKEAAFNLGRQAGGRFRV